MAFRVGQKVVCIKRDTWRSLRGQPDDAGALPKYGEVFTVDGGEEYAGKRWVILAELSHTYSFFEAWFKPAVEKQTDISIFTKILEGVGAGKVRERVE